MLSFGDFTATKPNEVHLIWEHQQSTQPNKLTGELSHEYLFSKYGWEGAVSASWWELLLGYTCQPKLFNDEFEVCTRYVVFDL